tara:strand:- start:24 stop:350 length:327 start_codon:yes stop_codon:yes gene_type:complete
MAQLSTKVKLYAEANGVSTIDFTKDIMLQDDGSGAYIKEWNLDITQPTDEQLVSYETEATKVENNAVIISARKQSYGTWEKQLEEINEQGLDAWKARIAQVKADNPKE